MDRVVGSGHNIIELWHPQEKRVMWASQCEVDNSVWTNETGNGRTRHCASPNRKNLLLPLAAMLTLLWPSEPGTSFHSGSAKDFLLCSFTPGVAFQVITMFSRFRAMERTYGSSITSKIV